MTNQERDAIAVKWISIKNCTVAVSVCGAAISIFAMSGSLVSILCLLGLSAISNVSTSDD